MKLKNLHDLLDGQIKDNDNLHRIAISNLADLEKRLIRWWSKKYNTPPKKLDDYTTEELLIEMLEDHYEKNPTTIEEFNASLIKDDWNGKIKDEDQMKEYWKKRSKVDLKKYQTDKKEATDEEIAKALEDIGKSFSVKKDDKEFEDEF